MKTIQIFNYNFDMPTDEELKKTKWKHGEIFEGDPLKVVRELYKKTNLNMGMVQQMRIEKFTYFYPEKPKLISKEQSLFSKISNHPDWIGEYKYNDCRLQLHNINNGFEFWDRHNKKLSYRPTDEVLDTLSLLKLSKGYNLFDGGLRHNKVTGIQNKIILYDVFVWDGEVLLNKSFLERRSILESHFKIKTDPVGITKQFKNNFDLVYNDAMEDEEFEGLVLKNKKGMLDLSRNSGRPSQWMFKVRKQTGRHRF